MAAKTTTVYEVDGMTCGHCVGSVTTAVGAVAGVADVEVDLPTGRVTVGSDGPVDDALVRAAVEEAGYAVKASR
ncbi:copper chaperone CopZ [Nocardiopsis mwathae]|uniref:Copper chaperone CopZ n=1 Tax=Nocardiopsis mwathae TaxID=1472723 RepID=A0A7W9YMA8_9ACTN|nr:heavy-metal-associated domain-containing protein [Nocardiopsis mwathae]MBB6174774.1 copper chaperone CopZ [Nocardiopsis mwathae]